MKKAVILFNLGGPDKLESVEPFLCNLFNDPAILNLPGIIRYPLAKFIANRRAPITKRIYEDLDERLGQSKFLAGESYTIADIATWPWIARHQWHDIGLANYNHLSRWYIEISKRSAVVKGFKFMDKNLEIPLP